MSGRLPVRACVGRLDRPFSPFRRPLRACLHQWLRAYRDLGAVACRGDPVDPHQTPDHWEALREAMVKKSLIQRGNSRSASS